MNTDNPLREPIGRDIEADLAKYAAGQRKHLCFVDEVSAIDPLLYDPKNTSDKSLRAAWGFADSFFDAAMEGFRDLDGIPWQTAVILLEDVIERLMACEEITDSRVLVYAKL